MPCASFAVVDIRTGEIFWPALQGVAHCGPFRPDEPKPLSFRLDSRLLVLTGSLALPEDKTAMSNYGPCGTFYYVMGSGGLKLIHTVLHKGAGVHPEFRRTTLRGPRPART